MITRTLHVYQISLCPDEDEKYDRQVLDFSQDTQDLSRGLYRYEVVRRDDYSDPSFNDGKLFQAFPIEEKVNLREVDEVWVFGAPTSTCSMSGPASFYLGRAPLLTRTIRRFPIMHIADDPLYTFVRRFEHTMYHVFRDFPDSKNHWEHFIRSEFSHPGQAACGSILYPPNGRMGEYNSKVDVLSECDDWLNFPRLSGKIRWINSSEWGGTLDGYMRWWLRHIPHGIHKSDGVHENWWHYVMNLDKVK